jgi:hypothetical protein
MTAMNRLDFRAFNKALDYREVARVLGIDLKGNKALCPFHNEKTPSFVFYRDHYHCFGCHESGDYIKLTAEMLCMSNFEAYKWLNDTFSMGFSSPGNTTVKRSFRKQQTFDYNAWLQKAKIDVADYIRIFRSLEETEFKDTADISGAEALHDRLLESDDAKEAFGKYESEVAQIGKKLERFRSYKDKQRNYRQFGWPE